MQQQHMELFTYEKGFVIIVVLLSKSPINLIGFICSDNTILMGKSQYKCANPLKFSQILVINIYTQHSVKFKSCVFNSSAKFKSELFM
jgi:hypothetical protein